MPPGAVVAGTELVGGEEVAKEKREEAISRALEAQERLLHRARLRSAPHLRF